MAVLLETTLGDIVVDLFTEERPKCKKSFKITSNSWIGELNLLNNRLNAGAHVSFVFILTPARY